MSIRNGKTLRIRCHDSVDGWLSCNLCLIQYPFSLRATFWEYLQAVLSYAIPYILLSIFLGPVYQWGLSQNFVPSFIAKLSPNNYHLVYYFGLKLALFIILVLLCKIVFHFTIGKILGKQRKSPKKGLRFLTNLPIALLFALSFSAWLVFSWPVWEYLTKEPLPKRLSNTAKIISKPSVFTTNAMPWKFWKL